jgi:DNA-binding HxlR family transcriptional regulator
MPIPQSPIGCPMDALLRLLMGPWTSYILWALRQNGPMRFGAIRRTVEGVSAKVLTERLRMLEQAGVIYREYKPRIPPEVLYGLTPRGRQLGPVLDSMDALARRWSTEDAKADGASASGTARPARPHPADESHSRADVEPTPIRNGPVVAHGAKRRGARVAAG